MPFDPPPSRAGRSARADRRGLLRIVVALAAGALGCIGATAIAYRDVLLHSQAGFWMAALYAAACSFWLMQLARLAGGTASVAGFLWIRFAAFFLVPAVYIGVAGPLHSRIEREVLALGLVTSGVFHLAFGLGLLPMGRRRRHEDLSELGDEQGRETHLMRMAGVAAVATVAVAGLEMWLAPGFFYNAAITDRMGITRPSTALASLFALLDRALPAVVLTVAIIQLQRRDRRLRDYLAAGALVLSLSPYLLSGTRAKFGAPIAIGLALLLPKLRRGEQVMACALVVLMLSTGGWFESYRYGGPQTGINAGADVVSGASRMMQRLNLAQFDGYLARHMLTGGEPLRGESLAWLPYMFVPRGLSEKPEAAYLSSYGATLQRVFSFVVVSGGSGPVPEFVANQDVQAYGELWWNFGLGIAVMGTFLLGVLIQGWEKILVRVGGNAVWPHVVRVCFLIAFVSGTHYFQGIVTFVLRDSLVIGALCFCLERSARWRPTVARRLAPGHHACT
ncbi:MAG: hypothetical protein ACRD26_16625 [Vicinamibacterales bacterium]